MTLNLFAKFEESVSFYVIYIAEHSKKLGFEKKTAGYTVLPLISHLGAYSFKRV